MIIGNRDGAGIVMLKEKWKEGLQKREIPAQC